MGISLLHFFGPVHAEVDTRPDQRPEDDAQEEPKPQEVPDVHDSPPGRHKSSLLDDLVMHIHIYLTYSYSLLYLIIILSLIINITIHDSN